MNSKLNHDHCAAKEKNVCSGGSNARNTILFIWAPSRMQPCSCSEDANLLPETTAWEVREVDTELQAKHFSILVCVRSDLDNKLRWWDLLRKLDGLGDGVVTRLYRALDLQICLFTICSVEGFEVI